ncbi:MAG: GNAT family N-acetyltransferase [Oscillospiraceae bacterium]|jgi:ribosomal-protein-alanine N-acetyltransferase|nr:GNAT family N-acetyltransferase [Oscillospiraceae bacterium]
MMMTREGLFSRLATLETPRLILRRLTMADAADIFSYSSDPEVARYVLWDAHRTIHDSRMFVRFILHQYRADDPSSWGVVLKQTGRVIGTIGFMWWNIENRSAEVGYSLARAYWGYGITTEALFAVLRFGFERMRLHRVEAQHAVENGASGRVMQKCGMRREGVLRGRLFSKNQFMDVALYAILEEDWRAMTRPTEAQWRR